MNQETLPIPSTIKCDACTAVIEINTYRKFTRCPYCDTIIPFPGFLYKPHDLNRSMYYGVEGITDCPGCRGEYMLKWEQFWSCEDCGLKLPGNMFDASSSEVLWFCDKCETYLDVQPGFDPNKKTWKCTVCGYLNDISENNIR